MKKTVKFVTVMLAAISVVFLANASHVQGKTLNKAMISFTFDDGYKSVFTQAMPVLKTYGIPGTVYIISDYVGYEYAMTWDQIWSLSYNNNWEIGNHTVDHPSLIALSDADVISQLRGARSTLESHGLINVTSLAYPYGDYNDHLVDLMIQDGTLYSGRVAWWEDYPTNMVDTFDQWRLIAVGADFPEKFVTIKPLIDEAILTKSWIILLFHDVVTTTPGEYEVARAELNKMAQYVYQNRSMIEAVTVSRGVGKMLNFRPQTITTATKDMPMSAVARTVKPSPGPPANIRVPGSR